MIRLSVNDSLFLFQKTSIFAILCRRTIFAADPAILKKTVIISVINDLATDQRVHRTAMTFQEKGYDVVVAGRKLKNSSILSDKTYKTRRFKLPAEKGPLFYLLFNMRLFFFLLGMKADLFYSNDLDTLFPNFLVSRIRNKKLIYDSHEYFTGVPELQNRKLVKWVWKKIERCIFPRLSHIITVNDSIAKLYADEYGKKVYVVRNVPQKNQFVRLENAHEFREKNNLPSEKKILILQGSGINIERGAEEAVEAMKLLDNMLLLIIGSGDVFKELEIIISENKLFDRVVLKNKMPYNELMQFTQAADLGLTLDKNTNLNYMMSLPNKLFDYLHAGVPVLSSDVIEVKKIVEGYDAGKTITAVTPENIAEAVKNIFSNNSNYLRYKENAKKASLDLTFEKEKIKLLEVINATEQ